MPPVDPSRILITGASGAIGAALAQAYAGPGRTLVLQGRNLDALRQTATSCRQTGSEVIVEEVDLLDRASAVAFIERHLGETTPDLVVLNAGMNVHASSAEAIESPGEAEDLLTLNMMRAQLLFDRVARAMLARGGGQIALVSSLAADMGLPPTPAYSASKAAVKSYGEAMRGALAPRGVRVSVIMPGYVRSPMCDAMPGPKPFLLSPEKAARRIRRGLAKDRGRIAFPFWLSLGTRWLGVLPVDWALGLLRRLGYRAP
ncbi:SDR family NAD(P)-dependent oxidoreductase [Guyparkeria hydrothermalis]|uniref:SDR family NAD(P)-dependent oxidoreductase n=1 Tax=Guyparkeria hydrothermalis TaxID=923 RepID=UPI002020F7D4|nr:SDR family NAD(P)-dependent oxidoreductase [Guyparkeria hydrothermalis]MCL7745488.1 SDR family NAD(P)-dependent oxidoreductase [Guyparkeria hydrothermalis]